MEEVTVLTDLWSAAEILSWTDLFELVDINSRHSFQTWPLSVLPDMIHPMPRFEAQRFRMF